MNAVQREKNIKRNNLSDVIINFVATAETKNKQQQTFYKIVNNFQ